MGCDDCRLNDAALCCTHVWLSLNSVTDWHDQNGLTGFINYFNLHRGSRPTRGARWLACLFKLVNGRQLCPRICTSSNYHPTIAQSVGSTWVGVSTTSR